MKIKNKNIDINTFLTTYGGKDTNSLYNWSGLCKVGDVVELEGVENTKSASASAHAYGRKNGFKVKVVQRKREGFVAVCRMS